MNSEQILTDTLHTLLCDKPHAGDMLELMNRDSEKCYYYLEESITEGNEMEDHLFWIDQAQQLKQLLGTGDPTVALTSIYRVLDLMEKFSQLSNGEQELFTLLRT